MQQDAAGMQGPSTQHLALRPNIYPHSTAGPFDPTSTHTARQGPSTQHLPTQPKYHLLLGLYAGIIYVGFDQVYIVSYLQDLFTLRN